MKKQEVIVVNQKPDENYHVRIDEDEKIFLDGTEIKNVVSYKLEHEDWSHSQLLTLTVRLGMIPPGGWQEDD